MEFNKERENKERGKWSPVLVNRVHGRKFNSMLFYPQKLINMHIYDNQLYAKVEDLNV